MTNGKEEIRQLSGSLSELMVQMDSEIADRIEEKTRAWRSLQNSKDEGEEKILKRVYNNKKNVLNKARRRLREKAMKEKVKEIESLRNPFPRRNVEAPEIIGGAKEKESCGNNRN